MAAGATATTSRRAPHTCTSTRSRPRSPIPSTPSPRRSPRATGGAWPSCSRSGKRATARGPRNSIFRRSCTSRPTGEPPSEGPMTTPESISAGRSPRPRAPPPPQEFLAHVRAGRASAHGQQGSAAKWAHAAMALAIRSLGRRRRRRPDAPRPDPASVLKIVERVMTRGRRPARDNGADLQAERCARTAARLAARDGPRRRRAQAAHPAPGGRAGPCRPRPAGPARARAKARRGRARHRDRSRAGPTRRRRAARSRLFDACIPAIPYAAASAFLGREKAKLARSDGDRPRVALVADGDRLDARRHAHDPADPRPRRARLRRRGDRHRRRRRPPAQRGRRNRRPVLPRAGDRRAHRPRDRRRARRGPLRHRARVLARTGGDRRLAARPGARAPARRQLPHRARRLCRAAHRPGPVRDARQLRTRHVLRGLRRRALAEPGQRRAAERAWYRRRANPALGSWRRSQALRPGAPRRRPAARTRSTCSTRDA